MCRRRSLGIMLGLVAALLLWVYPAHGDSVNQTRTITLADLGYVRDETLQGVRASRDWEFTWPDAWKINSDMQFNLHVSHSSSLDSHSSMAVDWNGTRLASLLLTAENAQDARLSVAVPAALVKPGYNIMHVEFYMGIRDNFCADLDNPAVWATVHNDSYMRVDSVPQTPRTDLSRWPAPLVDGSALITNTVTFVLPAQPTMAELNAAAAISAKLGQQAAWRPIQMDAASPESDSGLARTRGHQIVIASLDRLPPALKLPIVASRNGAPTLVNTAGQPVPDGAGVIWEQVSPFDPASALVVVTGARPDGVLQAARALAGTPDATLFDGPLGIVLQSPQIVPDAHAPGTQVSFESLGYRDITMQGSREQVLNYTFQLPFAWQVQDNAALDLHFAHSELLDANRSSLNVLLNDVPVGSLLLTGKNAKDAHVTFDLPARAFRAGENRLTVRTDIQMDRSFADRQDCVNDYYREAWAVVYGDSQFDLPGGSASFLFNLTGFPRALIKSANLADLGLIVPTAPDIAVAQALVRIAGQLGRSTDAAVLAPVVIDAVSKAQPALAARVVIGRPSQNEAIAELHDQLPQPFRAGTDEPEAVPALAQVVSTQGSIGYIQAVQDKIPSLVVTGTGDQGIVWAATALGDAVQIGKLKGDLAMLMGPGLITTADIRKAQVKALTPVTPAEKASPRSVPAWMTALAVGCAALALLVLLVIAWQAYGRSAERSTDVQ
jgi:hypothetical protein